MWTLDPLVWGVRGMQRQGKLQESEQVSGEGVNGGCHVYNGNIRDKDDSSMRSLTRIRLRGSCLF